MKAIQIEEKLKQAIRSDSRWIVIHSSVFHLKLGSQASMHFKWEFLSAARRLSNQGYQLAFPSFTFSFPKNRIFHKQLPSEVGVLADWVSELLGTERTNHPIYSHVLLGDNIEEAISCDTESCFGENSIYQFFEQENATIMMLGCDWSYCTVFHYFEQLYSVPYRYHKRFESSDGVGTTMFVRDEKLSIQNDFSPWQIEAIKAGKISRVNFAQGSLQSISFEALAEQCKKDLDANIFAYVKDAELLKHEIRNLQVAREKNSLKIAVLAESNYAPLLESLDKAFGKVLPQYFVELQHNEYGQMANDILSGKVAQNSPDFCFLPSRLEDLLHLSDIQFIGIDQQDTLLAMVDNYINLIKHLAQTVNRLVFVNLFPVSHLLLGQNALQAESHHVFQTVSELNKYLESSLEALENVRLLPVESLQLQQHHDPRLWYLGKIPYSVHGFSSLASHYTGLIAHECGESTRLLILDLDNTLWGGVLGEDGVEGIHLGGDFPGNAFKDFQRAILALHHRGIALAVASKNDESIALKAIESHPEMLIKESNLASYRINWSEKVLSIQSMAEEVGLGLSNVMFVDDNPLECEKVRKLLPEVKVIELPNDPVDYVSILLASPYLRTAQITAEDFKRSKSYVQKRRNKIKAEQFETLDEYFASLDVSVNVELVDDVSFARAVQLTNKTNQFNTTTRRFSDKDLKALLSRKDYHVAVASYEDNSTERELIGLIIVRTIEEECYIELLLLSCRVLGRSVESAMLLWAEQLAITSNLACLHGEIVKTERNTPVRDLFERHNFQKVNDNAWQMQLDKNKVPKVVLPYWLNVNYPLIENV